MSLIDRLRNTASGTSIVGCLFHIRQRKRYDYRGKIVAARILGVSN
jgi:hypothetical protein